MKDKVNHKKNKIQNKFLMSIHSTYTVMALKVFPPQAKFASTAQISPPPPYKILLHKHASTHSRAVFIQTITQVYLNIFYSGI